MKIHNARLRDYQYYQAPVKQIFQNHFPTTAQRRIPVFEHCRWLEKPLPKIELALPCHGEFEHG
jgi:hypothetical protein